MIAFLFESPNLPFTIALGLFLGIALLEGVTTVMGFGLSGLIDDILPDLDFDVDLDIDADVDLDVDVDIDADAPDIHHVGSAHALSRFWGWINVGRIPFLILFLLFLFGFGIIGIIIQSLSDNLIGRLLPGIVASLLSFVGTLYFVRITGKPLSKIIPEDETEAVSETSFIGRPAVITTGTARFGNPAQAKLQDHHGYTHYIMVEPQSETEVFETGSEVLIISQVGAKYLAVLNTSDPLSGSADPE